MPKKARELTALDVKRLVHSGQRDRHEWVAVGGVSGLQLQIAPSGGKSWLLRTMVGGKRRSIGLGPYPDVSLASAREAAREAKEKISKGNDPIEDRKAARAALTAAQRRGLVFKDAVDRCLAVKLDEFRNEKHQKQWRSSLDNYAVPEIGNMLVGEIEVQDVLRVLKPIWNEKTETASRLRGRIEAVLAWATVAGHRSGDNPAKWRGNLDAILAKPSKVAKVQNHAALPLDLVSDWFADLKERSGTATRALEFLTMTAARSGEVRGMKWAEVDLSEGLWTVPAERMKAGKEHRIPLTTDAADLLRGLPRKDSYYVFAAVRGGMLSDAALSAAMKRINEAAGARYADRRSGRPAVPHGLRSTFRDWAAERTEFPSDMAEIALAHTVGSAVERAYRRTDMLERRRAMMNAWADFLKGTASSSGTVVPIKEARA